MADLRPTVLVLVDDRDERQSIAAVLSEAGFAVIGAADPPDALVALHRVPVAAAVVALPLPEARRFLHQARRGQPGLKALSLVAPAAMRFADDEEAGSVVLRPCDSRELLGCVFELVLREENDPAPHHRRAAELAIAAARLACLHSQQDRAREAGR